MPAPQPSPAPVQNRIMNFHFNSYPKKAKENVQRAIEWHDKMSATCIKPKGRELSEKILNGVPRSEERRVGKECRCGGWRYDCQKNKKSVRHSSEYIS